MQLFHFYQNANEILWYNSSRFTETNSEVINLSYRNKASNSARDDHVTERNSELGLSALLEQDISSFEYFNTLSEDIKRKIEAKDIGSFQEMQEYVSHLKQNKNIFY